MTSKKINVAEFLYRRLVQLGCKSLHGLPGDFNLLALDFVVPSGLRWVGNCNELNAGYAADAYARVTGLGAIMTTFGVGELSAVNAIAGAYAELAPVVHIVGVPPHAAQQSHMFLHHTLGTGDYDVYHRIYKEITIAQAALLDAKTAPSEIDRVLRTCFVESRPVYIQLPTDVVTQEVDGSLLDTPISTDPVPGDDTVEAAFIDEVLVKLYAAKNAAIIVDGAVQRRRIRAEVDTLVSKLDLPAFVTPMGKGLVDEELPNFRGLYAGEGSDPAVKHAFEQTDLVLTIGEIKSDLNTTGFTNYTPPSGHIELHYDHCLIDDKLFNNARLKTILPKLTNAIDPSKLATHASKATEHPISTAKAPSGDSDDITHAWLWSRLTGWFRPGDLIVTDTGTSYVGYWGVGLPKDTTIINQIIWSSIGYGVGAAQGAALAALEEGKGRRTICFEGDGSFQLTAQELSTVIRHGMGLTMFLIENDGYTIERFVHGLEASYNDVMQWRYADLPHVFAQDRFTDRIKTWKIGTRSELDTLLSDDEFANGKGLQFVEMHMDKLDAPQVLKDFGENAAKRAS